MESREELLSAYGRYLELEQLLPGWGQTLQEQKKALQKAEEDLCWQKHALKEMENPNFFQRLMNWEAKTEKAREEYRGASAAYEKRKWDTDQQETAVTAARREFEALAQNLTLISRCFL